MGPLFLLIAAFLWGTAFVAQKYGADHLGPFAVIFGRNIIASAFLLLCVRVRRAWLRARSPDSHPMPEAGCPRRSFSRRAVFGGAVGGVALFLASLAQQVGIAETTPGISAFLTANYMLVVPVIGFAVGRRAGLVTWCGVVLALIGTYFICIAPGTGWRIGPGEAWTLLCAVLFAVQILLVDRFAPGTDIFAFSCVQQFAGAVCAFPFLLLASETAHFTAADIAAAAGPVLFLAIASSGIAYTCQNLGQTRTPPALAAILMSLESVFGVLAGWVICGDTLSARQLVGCAIVFVAVVVPQLFERADVPKP